ncbi:leucine-rich_repeat domain-containing protein [Hexamita inflata]|uniref:Leucine-rich repeat domain-containing protein n=1 Tax=Hexamita inflata TaxID=28002 RepID=A0AA86UMN2_9EUKA|nr:leucine-rich repeat domain-containing protein [Hexamita inflata]
MNGFLQAQPAQANQHNNFEFVAMQTETEDEIIEVLRHRCNIFGQLNIIISEIKNLNFIETLNVHKVLISYCRNIIPAFTSKTVKELELYKLTIENFKNINLENLDILKITCCEKIKECELFTKVRRLELICMNVELIQNKIFKNIKELIINSCNITNLDMQIENVEILHIINTFSNQLNIQNITMYQHLKELFICMYDDIDTTPLQQLTKLISVQFEKCNNMIINFKSDDITKLELISCQLKQMECFQLQNLKTLNIRCFDKIATYFQENINTFQNLNDLDLSLNERINISLLNDLTNLYKLNLSDCKLQDITNMNPLIKDTQNIDISPLKFQVQLNELNLNNCGLNTIDVLQYLINLKQLDLNNNNIDLSPLQNLVELRVLNLEGCNLIDVDSLKLLLNLEELNLSNQCGVDDTLYSNIRNLNPCGKLNIDSLCTLINLKKLSLSCNLIDDITVLHLLTELEMLNLSKCQLLNVDTLKTLSNLKALYLNQNKNIDITPLQYLTQLTLLEIKKCGQISIEALIPLQKLKYLNLQSNSIIYAKPLEYLKQLVGLDVMCNKLTNISTILIKTFDLKQQRIFSEIPTKQEIQFANILRDINAPVTLLRAINQKRKYGLKNTVNIGKNTINTLLKQSISNLVQFTKEVAQTIQQQNYFENLQ